MKYFPALAAGGELAETFRAGKGQIGLRRGKVKRGQNDRGGQDYGFHESMDAI